MHALAESYTSTEQQNLQFQASCCRSASVSWFKWHRTVLHQERILSRNQGALFSLPLQCFWSQAIPQGMLELAVPAQFPVETKLKQSHRLCLFIHPQQLKNSSTIPPKSDRGVKELMVCDKICDTRSSLLPTVWDKPTWKAAGRVQLLSDTRKHYTELPQTASSHRSFRWESPEDQPEEKDALGLEASSSWLLRLAASDFALNLPPP